MRRRRLLAIAGLALLVALSGCSILGGGGEIDQDELTKNATYDWNTTANATYDVTTSALLSFSSNSYQAVLNVENRSTISLYESTLFRGDQSISIEALQFRFRNGSQVNATHPNLTAVEHGDETTIELPVPNGSVAYTSSWGGTTTAWGGSPRSWSVQTPMDGSHEVRMPAGSRTNLPFLSRTTPSPSETTVRNDRSVIRWNDIDSGAISVRYYLGRDLYLFGGIFALVTLVGLVGVAHYYRAIQRAQEQREAVGLDIEYDEDEFDDDGPPPGMR